MSALAPTPELLAADRGWARDFCAALTTYSKTGGTYVNFLAEQTTIASAPRTARPSTTGSQRSKPPGIPTICSIQRQHPARDARRELRPQRRALAARHDSFVDGAEP
jgi:hypothetical protein